MYFLDLYRQIKSLVALILIMDLSQQNFVGLSTLVLAKTIYLES